MSSVKIQGSATGTANFTIAVPDGTSTDRTINLPDAAGSFVLADASGDVTVTGAFTSQGIDDNATSTAMTLDSSGNLLVGKTAADAGVTAGAELQSSGLFYLTRTGTPTVINRLGSDGDIAAFRKDGTTVGNIGTSNGKLQVNSSGGNNLLIAVNGTNYAAFDTIRLYPITDNSYDLGVGSNRFDDIYATNPTIQTSDANLKTAIASLTDAEITAAKAISKLFKTFKWNDKVAEKGDAARTHSGVIAQEVQQAMTDAGLDAGNYAFFISSTWWEADETYIDDDGVEQTRTNTYDTAEEAPEGATQRTRLGIRYPELLAFIGAATEQRLASIEARLDVLEAV